MERSRILSTTYSVFFVHLDAASREKGTAFLTMLYEPDRATDLFATWGADFEWLTKEVVHGMFYADDAVLDFTESELITYMAIACQGLFQRLCRIIWEDC